VPEPAPADSAYRAPPLAIWSALITVHLIWGSKHTVLYVRVPFAGTDRHFRISFSLATTAGGVLQKISFAYATSYSLPDRNLKEHYAKNACDVNVQAGWGSALTTGRRSLY
jgi:hypothetical protein